MTDLQREAKEIADFSELLGFDEYQVCKDAIALLRRIERGELVEVVRCGECVHHSYDSEYQKDWCNITLGCRRVIPNDFCSQWRKPDEHR